MLDILIHRNLLRQIVHIAIHDHADVSTFLRLFKKLLMLTLTSSDDRRKHLDSRLLRQPHDSIHHLINRLFLDRTSTLRTMWNTDPRIEQTKIVIDLRHGSDR